MVAALVDRGHLTPEWRDAFEAVPRHLFIPETVYRQDDDTAGHDYLPLHRADDPDGWLHICYTNMAITTQVDDGHPDERGRGWEPTSSSSMPSVVADMLAALAVEPGMRVLEIGTGTGWNTALLAWRIGAENVTTIEIDPVVAGHARAALDAAGYDQVCLITRDGALGWAAEAPYDRVIATVGAPRVPHAWVRQTRPGGLVLVPWGNTYYPGDLLRLTVHDDQTATGRVIGDAAFMDLRSQRTGRESGSMLGEGDIETSTTELHPYWVALTDPATAIGWWVDCRQYYTPATEHRPGRFNLIDRKTQSWARITLAEESPHTVEQAGPRRLWDEVKRAYQRWLDLDQPSAGDWLVTVDKDGQRVELKRS
jgi:protein-L-isoaspartate(D-aspartate) O-methyltransferase